MRLFKVLFLSIIAFSCSNGEEFNQQTGNLNILKGYEKLVYSRPQDVLDSLSWVVSEFKEKSEYSAYSALLYSIAFEQKYGTLRIDSIINKSAQWYSIGEDYSNRCRSMLYKSIALYSLNRVDSNAYLTIKEAESLYKKIDVENNHIGATLFLYLGRMNRARSQAGVAEEYLKKSLELSSLANYRTGVL
ncbi:MAG: hypothetical protein Q8S04_10510, partial [Bacteroidales bacterium]|nr:hypothetical protein [Bacteroidales bacterium]